MIQTHPWRGCGPMRHLGWGFAATLALTAVGAIDAAAQDFIEPPMLVDAVEAGTLDPVAARLPNTPLVLDFEGQEIGEHGGQWHWMAGRARDIRIMNVYGYSRLVGYDEDYTFVADILDDFTVEDGRIFTLTLRPGHRWSDGAPFTTEDFRYLWFDVQLNEELRPYGPDYRMFDVDGNLPTVEVIDPLTVRYSWDAPNPEFLPALAGARPLYLYAPSHYLRQFHRDYRDAEELQTVISELDERDWITLHLRRDDLYDADNPDLPTLQPWVNITEPPSERFVFQRNPYFHRVDPEGRQLPYIDEVVVTITNPSLIPARVGAGEAHLQSRHLRFDNFTFLSQSEERSGFTTYLWPTALGAELALYPNQNVNDDVWRAVIRDVRFRRALSVAINRDLINEVLYFGLGRASANSALPQSPLYDEERATSWYFHDPDLANQLLDEMGLTERNEAGLRLLPDGRPMEIVVETAGERTEEIDALQLVAEDFQTIGIDLYINNSQRDIFRTRIFSGDTAFSIWFGFDNALFTPNTVPAELAPIDQNWLYGPKWGQYYQTGGDTGVAPDADWAVRLMELYDAWSRSTDTGQRETIVREMLDINAEEVVSIGIIQGGLQPVVVDNTMRNVPEEGTYSWDPGAHFGVYNPDTFWFAEQQ